MNDSMRSALKRLRLSGMAESLDVRLQEASGNHLSHVEFLELVLQDELAVRSERLIRRRVKAAAFRELKTLEDFDWTFNTSIKRKQVYDLATGRFIRENKDVLLLGPPGTGKSHLCQALGYQEGMRRELMEEVAIDEVNETAVAVINDDSTDVGTVHFGVVHVVRVADENVAGRRSGIVSPEFIPIAEAAKDPAGYESWSRFCLEHMDLLLAKAVGKDAAPERATA